MIAGEEENSEVKKNLMNQEKSDALTQKILDEASYLMEDAFGFGEIAVAIVQANIMTALQIKYQMNMKAADGWIEALVKSLNESWEKARHLTLDEEDDD